MSILGMDLGGTKLAVALFAESGELLFREVIILNNRKGAEVGALITGLVKKYLISEGHALCSIGVSVPGISRQKTGTVWAPNIEGWDDYPLLEEIKQVSGNIPVSIDSDRASSILGELWQGNARGCRDVIYLAVGTGIGAGILIDGKILRGAQDISGAIGWMALNKPFQDKYISCGCFEYYASGEGIVKYTREILDNETDYKGRLRKYAPEKITAYLVFEAFEENDPVAVKVIRECIGYWGMAVANLISLFNPEKIIFGGGVFGPAVKFIDEIKAESIKWAQPISVKQVSFESSALSSDAGMYGAGFLALKNIGYVQN